MAFMLTYFLIGLTLFTVVLISLKNLGMEEKYQGLMKFLPFTAILGILFWPYYLIKTISMYFKEEQDEE